MNNQAALHQLELLWTKHTRKGVARGYAELSIGANHGPSVGLLPAAMAEFGRSHPLVNLKLYTGTSSEIEDLLLKAKIDIAITSNARRHSRFNSTPFRDEKLCIFAPIDHPLAREGAVTAADISAYALVIRTRRDGDSRTEDLIAKLREVGLTSPIAMRCESFDSVKAAVRQRAGLGILHHDLLHEEVRRKEFVILELAGVDMTYRSYILYSRNNSLSAHAQEFLTFLRLNRDRPERQSKPRGRARRIPQQQLRSLSLKTLLYVNSGWCAAAVDWL